MITHLTFVLRYLIEKKYFDILNTNKLLGKKYVKENIFSLSNKTDFDQYRK